MKDNQIKQTSLASLIEEPFSKLVELRGKKIAVEYIPTFDDLKGYAGEDGHHFAVTIPLPSGFYDLTDETRERDEAQFEIWLDYHHPENEVGREF